MRKIFLIPFLLLLGPAFVLSSGTARAASFAGADGYGPGARPVFSRPSSDSLSWRDVCASDDAYWDTMEGMDRRMEAEDQAADRAVRREEMRRTDRSDDLEDEDVESDEAPARFHGRWAGEETYHRWRDRRIQRDRDNVEILKNIPLDKRQLLTKYKRIIAEMKEDEELKMPRRPRKSIPRPQRMIKESRESGKWSWDNSRDLELYDRDPLEDRDLIQKYNRLGVHNPDNDKDVELEWRNPLEDRDLIQKYNRKGVYNPDNDRDVELEHANPLEDRNLIEKYNRKGVRQYRHPGDSGSLLREPEERTEDWAAVDGMEPDDVAGMNGASSPEENPLTKLEMGLEADVYRCKGPGTGPAVLMLT